MSFMGLVYRTANALLWGGGQGSDLSPQQVDMNFWLLYQAITDLQTASDGAGIDYMVITGNILSVHLTNHAVLQFEVPTAQWNFRGPWTPNTSYAVMDVVTNANIIYLVIFAHTSQETFDPTASDGLGHNYYAPLLGAPANQIPMGGTAGQVLVSTGESPEGFGWQNLTRVMSFYVQGTPSSYEEVFRYIVVEPMTMPVSLTGSQGNAATPPTAAQYYLIYQNETQIGTIAFSTSPEEVTFLFAAEVTFAPGDIVTIIAPASPDPHMTNICVSILATLP